MNIIVQSVYAQERFSKLLNEMSGYETLTTFYQDFTIADNFGEEGIIDTYKRAMDPWKCDYKYITELYMVLNHKIWEHYESENQALAKLYYRLWRECRCWCDEHFSKEELEYFYYTTD